MAKFTGKNGRIQFTGKKIVEAHEWSADIDAPAPESTAFTDSPWKTFEEGLISGRATVRCFADSVTGIPRAAQAP